MTKRTTKDRILDASEALFARDGSSGASLRAITQRAKVNLAAVHYHFGSKDYLLEAVLARAWSRLGFVVASENEPKSTNIKIKKSIRISMPLGIEF